MTTHLLLEEENGYSSACLGEHEGDRGLTLEKALDPNSKDSIDCVECHKVLTGGSKHITEEDFKTLRQHQN